MMFNKIIEKVKIISFFTSILLIILVASEKNILLTQAWNQFWLMDWVCNFWFVTPALITVAFIIIDEVRRRKFISRYINLDPFTFTIDTIILVITLGLALYRITVCFGWSSGLLLNTPIRNIIILGSVYLGIQLLRYQKRKRDRKNNSVKVPQMVIHPDRPITEINEDKLERSKFAIRIATTLESNGDKESLVVGLYGKWGSGKTSVLNMIKNHILQNQKTLIINYNPWYFENDGHLISHFFETFTKEVEKSYRGDKGELVKKLKSYSQIISPVSLKLGLASISFKDILNIFKKKDKNIIELRNDIEDLLEKNGQRIVVIIDDLDRLDDKEVHAVVKLVKLIADFPYTAYILAFDNDVVATALSKQYGEGSTQAGESFLEKIIQIPLHLPPADEIIIRDITLVGLSGILEMNKISLTEDEKSRLVSVWDRSILKLKLNIRLIKRYLNAVTFAVPLLKEEINNVDLFCIEGLRAFFPKVHRFILEHSEAFLTAGRSHYREEPNISEKYKPMLEKLFREYSTYEVKIIKDLLEDLFPRSKYLFTGNNHYGYDWDKEWTNGKRICSEDYFERYFLYTVPSKQFSDVAFHKLISLTEDNECQVDHVSDSIIELAKDRGYKSLIKKLRQVEDELPSNSCIIFAKSLSKMGESFPTYDGMLGSSTSTQAAILIKKLIEKIPKDNQVEFAKEIMMSAEPIAFTLEIFRWLRPSKEKNENVFSESDISHLATFLIERIRQTLNSFDSLEKFSDIAHHMLWIWSNWGDKNELQNIIKEWLNGTDEVERFLIVFINQSYDMATGIPVRSDFDIDNYKNVKVIFPPEEIAKKLLMKYSMPVAEGDYYRAEERTIKEQVAIQFLWIHSRQNLPDEAG